jgi:radical SAM superfamily enzyme YgiQ (UPF0313 family)
MTDILLTHSYHLPYDRKQLRKMQPYPPLATLYAAANLRQLGFSVAVFDTMLEDPVTGFPRALAAHQPKIVVVYEDDFNFLTKMCLTRMREVAWQMASQARAANAVAIVHGSDAADHIEEFLRAGFDFVLLGESETTLAEMCDFLLGDKNPDLLPGIAILDESTGKVVRTGQRRSHPPRIDANWPARDLVDMKRYRNLWESTHGRFSLNLISSRGCPFRCNWCAKPIFGDSFSVRPAEDVADEVAELVSRFGAEHLWFADDVFALNRHWIADFADAVAERNCAIPFKIQSRADLMTVTTVDALRRAGCTEVWMGVESGSQSVLDAMDKGLRIEDVTAARENLRANSIQACYFLQFGYPGESWSDILATLQLVRETRPDDVGISFSYPLPGTRFHSRVREQLGTKRNWTDSDDLCVMFKGAYTNEFYRSIRDAVHAEVNNWNGNGPQLSRSDIAKMWRNIERNESVSRNPDATAFTPQSHSCTTAATRDFISLGNLTAAGANLG